MLEYCGIWVMVAITALTELQYSVLCGLVMALIIFVYKYGKKGAVKAILTGAEYQSCVVRNHRDQIRLQHLGKKLLVQTFTGAMRTPSPSHLKLSVSPPFQFPPFQ